MKKQETASVHAIIVQQAACGFLAAFWAVAGLWHFYHLRRWRRLPSMLSPDEETLPGVCVLLPARNEAGRILPECVESILAQNYPTFAIVAVNDCSTDGTGEILRGLAARENRLRVVDGTPPPTGWMGKPHALAQGMANAPKSAEWLLLTDADVVFDADLLRDAMVFALRENWDALTLSPRHGTDSFWVRGLLPAYEWIVTAGLPLVHRDGAGDEMASACGAFFLIRRDALEKIGGFDAVRDRSAEDITLARRLKASGARLAYLRAKDRFWTPHYRNAAELRNGWAKNLWTPDFGILPGVFLALFLWFVGAGPLAFLLATGTKLAAVAFFTQVIAFAPGYSESGGGTIKRAAVGFGEAWRAIFAPLAMTLAAWLVLQAIFFYATGRRSGGGGAVWKDRPVYLPPDDGANKHGN